MKRYEFEQQHGELGQMRIESDGEWVRYEDHCEAMKRIAGDGAEPYNGYQRDWEKVVRWVKFQSETFPELASMSPEGAISWLVVELAARHEKFAEPSVSPADQDDYKAMFSDAARDMAAIDAVLGIDPEEAGGAEPILIAIEDLQAERNAWKAYAEHQEHCATCGEAVSDCETGTQLRSMAMSATPPAAGE